MHITLVAALAVSMVVCLLIALASEEAANRLEESGETHVSARIIKHREGGRGDVVIWSDSQNVWAVNPQVSRS